MPNLSYHSHDELIASWGSGLEVGLLTQAPSPDGSGIVEPNGNGYARQPINFSKEQREGVTFLRNDGPLVYGPAVSAQWPSVQWFALFDSAGRLRLYGRLRTARATPVGEATTFPVNDIEIRLR